MPKSKKTTKPASKSGNRTTKRKQNKKQVYNRVSVPVGLGFPKRMVMTHKYVLQGSIDSTLGVINNYRFSCNNLYAPSTGGTSHQPLYFDQMASIYNHATVIGSKIMVKWVPRSATQGSSAVGIFINDDTSQANISDITAMAEQSQGSKPRLLPASSNNVVTQYAKWSAKKFFGGSILGNDNLQCSTSAGPAEQSYFQLFYQDLTGATSSIDFVAEIWYIAVWDELKDIAQS